MYQKKAFAIIELILVILIIGILAAIAMPRLGGRDFFIQLTLRTAAHQIVSDIRYTRRLAIANSERYLIRFYDNRNEYGIYRRSIRPNNLIGEMKEVPPGINMYFSDRNRFRFERLGNASRSGTLTLRSGDSEEHQYDVIVEPVTGAVIMEKIS